MRLYFNRNTTAITRDPASGASLADSDPAIAKRGDSGPLQIAFHRDGVLELPVSPLIAFVVKKLKDYEGAAVILTTDFTAPGDISGFYVGLPDLTSTAVLEALFTGELVATAANAAARKALTGKTNGQVVKQTDTEPPTYWQVIDATSLSSDDGWSEDVTLEEFVDFGAEIVLKESPGFGEESSRSFVYRIYADYLHDNETAPAAGIPFTLGFLGNRFDITGLTGGTATDLDAIVTATGNVRPGALIAIDVAGAATCWRLRTSPVITSSSVANPSVITTARPHGYPSGKTVTIGGHVGSTPDINGDHVITVLSSTTFSIPVNVTVAGAGGFATRAEETAAGIVRPDDFNAGTNPVTWNSVL